MHDAEYELYVVSNGSEEMVDRGDLDDLLEETISADELSQFKPGSELYRHAADRIGTPVEEIAFVAAGWWDVPGGINAGIQDVWVDRQDTLWGPYETEPDLTIESFHELAGELETE